MQRTAGLAEQLLASQGELCFKVHDSNVLYREAGAYCAVRAEPYYIIRINFSLSRVASNAISTYMLPSHRHLTRIPKVRRNKSIERHPLMQSL